METNALAVHSPVEFENAITSYEFHAHQPYGSTHFGNSDEIRINVQNQDLCILPSKSHLHIVGRLTKDDITAVESTKLVNNAICHLFEEIRYELNGIEIDKTKNVGITSIMKNFSSLPPNYSYESAGWVDPKQTLELTNADGYFDISLPLNMVLGFAEDYQKILINSKHELVLLRSRTDANAVIQTANENFKLNVLKIEWLIPYVKLSDNRKVKLLNFIQRDPPISLGFRSWELYEYPVLPTTSKHIWTVKTSTQLEKPRFVILGFQINRRNQLNADTSRFDHCKISNVKLFLNSDAYPYNNLNLDISNNQFSLLYGMYASFQQSYYDKSSNPLLDRETYLSHSPLIVIDCSKQNESLKQGPVDVRLEFEAKENFPANTTAYCLILHDRIIEYRPISGIVKKLM